MCFRRIDKICFERAWQLRIHQLSTSVRRFALRSSIINADCFDRHVKREFAHPDLNAACVINWSLDGTQQRASHRRKLNNVLWKGAWNRSKNRRGLSRVHRSSIEMYSQHSELHMCRASSRDSHTLIIPLSFGKGSSASSTGSILFKGMERVGIDLIKVASTVKVLFLNVTLDAATSNTTLLQWLLAFVPSNVIITIVPCKAHQIQRSVRLCLASTRSVSVLYGLSRWLRFGDHWYCSVVRSNVSVVWWAQELGGFPLDEVR